MDCADLDFRVWPPTPTFGRPQLRSGKVLEFPICSHAGVGYCPYL